MVLVQEHKYQLTANVYGGYTLDFGYKKVDLNFSQLMMLRTKINTLTTSEAIEEIIDNDNFILLFIADNQHLLYLDIPQLLQLKNTITVAFA